VALFYRIGLMPLLGMSRQVMLLTTQGRKTHALRATPIGYFRIDGQVYVFSAWGKATNWYQNLLACPDEVYVHIGFQRRRATAQEVSDPQEIQRLLERFVQQDPQGARTLFGWDPAQDRIEAADFSAMIAKVLVVRFVTD
jgi:deazaflavin-dependent oxidoreductase (nitroreductase family)